MKGTEADQARCAGAEEEGWCRWVASLKRSRTAPFICGWKRQRNERARFAPSSSVLKGWFSPVDDVRRRQIQGKCRRRLPLRFLPPRRSTSINASIGYSSEHESLVGRADTSIHILMTLDLPDHACPHRQQLSSVPIFLVPPHGHHDEGAFMFACSESNQPAHSSSTSES